MASRPPDRPWSVKIADFGISKRIPANQQWQLSFRRGSFHYFAPEVVRYVAVCRDSPGAVDIWSVGIIVYHLATRQFPFELPTLSQFCKGQEDLPTQPMIGKYSDQCIDFVENLLKPLPQDRPSAETARLHPWIISPPVGSMAPFTDLVETDPSDSVEASDDTDGEEEEEDFLRSQHLMVPDQSSEVASILSLLHHMSDSTASQPPTPAQVESRSSREHLKSVRSGPSRSHGYDTKAEQHEASAKHPGTDPSARPGLGVALQGSEVMDRPHIGHRPSAFHHVTMPQQTSPPSGTIPPSHAGDLSLTLDPHDHVENSDNAARPDITALLEPPASFHIRDDTLSSLINRDYSTLLQARPGVFHPIDIPEQRDCQRLNRAEDYLRQQCQEEERRNREDPVEDKEVDGHMHQLQHRGDELRGHMPEVDEDEDEDDEEGIGSYTERQRSFNTRQQPVRRATAPIPFLDIQDVIDRVSPRSKVEEFAALANERPFFEIYESEDTSSVVSLGPQLTPSRMDASSSRRHNAMIKMPRSISDSFMLIPEAVDRADKTWRRHYAARRLAEQRFSNDVDALSWAIEYGEYEIVDLLLDRGIDTETRFHDDLSLRRGTALHFAIVHGKAAVVQVLLRQGADKEAKADGVLSEFNLRMRNLTPLHLAAYYGHEDIARMLIDAGASIEANATGGSRDKKRRTPLHLAVLGLAYKAARGLIRFLVRHGADPRVKDLDGMQPGDYWKMMGRSGMVDLLPASEDFKAKCAKFRKKYGTVALAAIVGVASAVIMKA